MSARILSTAHCAGSRVVKNYDLEKVVTDYDAEKTGRPLNDWILEHYGKEFNNSRDAYLKSTKSN